jgi:hypothetical protein
MTSAPVAVAENEIIRHARKKLTMKKKNQPAREGAKATKQNQPAEAATPPADQECTAAVTGLKGCRCATCNALLIGD